MPVASIQRALNEPHDLHRKSQGRSFIPLAAATTSFTTERRAITVRALGHRENLRITALQNTRPGIAPALRETESAAAHPSDSSPRTIWALLGRCSAPKDLRRPASVSIGLSQARPVQSTSDISCNCLLKVTPGRRPGPCNRAVVLRRAISRASATCSCQRMYGR